MKRLLLASALLVLTFTGCGWMGRQAIIAYLAVDTKVTPRHISIEIGRSFIEEYQNRVTIHTLFTVDKAMAAPLPTPFDGDLHFAGRAPQVALPVVAEIADAAEEKAGVDLANRAAASHGRLRVSGVWRIWPEHAGHQTEEQGKPLPAFDTDLPGHVFEIHPVMRMNGLPLLDSFKPIKGFTPGDAERTFGIFQKASCTLAVTPKTVTIVADNGLYNDVEFVMKIASDPQLVVRDGRFVMASAMDAHGKLLVERLRMVFAEGTQPEQAVRLLGSGDQLHVYGIPRLDFAEIARRVKSLQPGTATRAQPLPYEIVILGVYPK
ncbi:MAG TPA: hypothetical protein VLC46_01685 [Thermoanaerobaculia bacterium]|jgi:hypothetical protein|nr:hypothetical protein [Thermoanaerobaculia bacterium]